MWKKYIFPPNSTTRKYRKLRYKITYTFINIIYVQSSCIGQEYLLIYWCKEGYSWNTMLLKTIWCVYGYQLLKFWCCQRTYYGRYFGNAGKFVTGVFFGWYLVYVHSVVLLILVLTLQYKNDCNPGIIFDKQCCCFLHFLSYLLINIVVFLKCFLIY